MSLPSGASLAAGESKRIEDALAELAKKPDDKSKDHHAPREIYVLVNLSYHHEYPRAVYKGRNSINVQNESELAAALAQGYSKEAPQPESEEE